MVMVIGCSKRGDDNMSPKGRYCLSQGFISLSHGKCGIRHFWGKQKLRSLTNPCSHWKQGFNDPPLTMWEVTLPKRTIGLEASINTHPSYEKEEDLKSYRSHPSYAYTQEHHSPIDLLTLCEHDSYNISKRYGIYPIVSPILKQSMSPVSRTSEQTSCPS